MCHSQEPGKRFLNPILYPKSPKIRSLHPALASPRPLVFAHRGGSKLGPEKTVLAFDRGLEAGADGLELDVRLSRDGLVIVHHDLLLGRTSRGAGPVHDHTAE